MPYSFMGFGTRYYGRRDPGTDGSFVTTEWIVMAMTPILPVRSVRVVSRGEPQSSGRFPVVGFSRQYIVKPASLNWRQILNVYCAGAAIWALAFAVTELHDPTASLLGIGTIVGIAAYLVMRSS